MTKKQFAAAVARALTGLRLAKRLTQAEIAAGVGVSREAVTQWECVPQLPQLDRLLSFAKTIGEHPATVFEAIAAEIRRGK